MGWVATNGLNAWVIVLSGELSMVRVPVADFEFGALVELLDEHALAPAARRAATVTAASFLWPRNLEIIFGSCPSKRSRPPRFPWRRASSSCPTPLRPREYAGGGDVKAPA